MTSLVHEETLPALSIAEVAYALSQRLALSRLRMSIRNEASTALLQLDVDACLHLNRVYTPDERPEFLFFMHELASALHEWRVHSEHAFDVGASILPSSVSATSDIPAWDVHVAITPCALPRTPSTSEAMLDAHTAPLRVLDARTSFYVARVILDTGSMNSATDIRAAFNLHQLLIPLMVHWMLQSHACDVRPLMLSVYVSASSIEDTLLMRLYVHQRAVTETRTKRRKLAASGFNDTMYIAVTPCTVLEAALRQRLHKMAPHTSVHAV